MKIKKGDKVIVLSGDDKGKTGEVQKVYPRLNKVVVEGVNVHKKHKKPTQNTPEGSILDIYVPLDASKVALIDPKTKKAARVHYKTSTVRKSGSTAKVNRSKRRSRR